MLETQVVPITFDSGIDTKSDSKALMPTKLTRLENGIFTKAKKINKRNGYAALSTTILNPFANEALEPGVATAAYNDEMITISANKLYSYSPTEGGWFKRGRISPSRVTSQRVSSGTYDRYSADSVSINGLTAYVWVENGNTLCTVVDKASGTEIQSRTIVTASANAPKLLAFFESIIVVYGRGNNLYYNRINTNLPAVFLGEVTLAGGGGFSGPNSLLDAVAIENGALSASRLTYATSTGFKVLTLDSGFSITSTVTNTADIPDLALTIVLDNSSSWYVLTASSTNGLVQTTALGRTVLDATELAISRITGSVLTNLSNTPLVVYYECQVPTVGPVVADKSNHWVKSVHNTLLTTQIIQRSCGLASKAVKVGPVGANNRYKHLLTLLFDSVLQATYFNVIVDHAVWGSFYNTLEKKVIARVWPLQGGGQAPIGPLPNLNTNTDGTYFYTTQFKYKTVNQEYSTTTLRGLAITTLDMNSPASLNSEQVNGNLFITCAAPQIYDGAQVVEAGFNFFPELLTWTPVAGAIPEGSYTYFFMYEWTDSKGQIHRSAPSIGVTIDTTGLGPSAITWDVPTLRVTDRQNVRVVAFRTQKNGTIANRVLSVGGEVVSNTAADIVQVVDNSLDSAIISNEIMYTTGGVLENIAPPACTTIAIYKTRVILGGLEDSSTLWFSKTVQSNEPVSFNDSLVIKIDTSGGPDTAVKEMDGKLIVFKRSSIFLTYGDPPNDLGEQNNLAEVQRLVGDAGCADGTGGSSCVVMPEGLMFKTAKGIYLLNRSLQLSYIGAEAEDYNSQTVVSADLIDTKNQVRFLCSSGLALVYDYIFKQWGTFTNHIGLDASIVAGLYYYVRADGAVWQETPGVFSDAGTKYSLLAETAWIKVAGLQSFQRARRAAIVADYKTAHTLSVQAGYDYKTAYTDTYTFAAGTVVPATDNVYQFRMHLKNQKCEALRFLISDTLATAGEGYGINELSLELGMKRGIRKMRAEKST